MLGNLLNIFAQYIHLTNYLVYIFDSTIFIDSFVSILHEQIYSDIHSWNFRQPNLFGHSFVSIFHYWIYSLWNSELLVFSGQSRLFRGGEKDLFKSIFSKTSDIEDLLGSTVVGVGNEHERTNPYRNTRASYLIHAVETSSSRVRNVLLRATKSVSQFNSTWKSYNYIFEIIGAWNYVWTFEN